ncbi:MAG: RnfH family protein [Gammaproteobacteria bacterium]
MRVFLSIQHPNLKVIQEIEVSNRATAAEILNLSEISKLIKSLDFQYIVGVNGEVLDGKYFPKPEDYRLKPNDRVEILRELYQDPKVRRKKKVS